MAQGAVIFNVATFRTQYPAFANPAVYSNASLQVNFDTATMYVQNRLSCNGLSRDRLTLALNLMTAHLAELNALAAAGDPSGVLTSASIDKVSVTVDPPPKPNQFQWWLNQTPYGQQLLALLQVAGVGGWYVGGHPEIGALRRGGGFSGWPR